MKFLEKSDLPEKWDFEELKKCSYYRIKFYTPIFLVHVDEMSNECMVMAANDNYCLLLAKNNWTDCSIKSVDFLNKFASKFFQEDVEISKIEYDSIPGYIKDDFVGLNIDMNPKDDLGKEEALLAIFNNWLKQ